MCLRSEAQYKVTYRNQSKPEYAYYMTLEEARQGAEFLKFQGATSVRVKELT